MAKAAPRSPTLAMKRNAAQEKDRAKYGAKRDKILQAAGPVLQRNGLNGTTVEAIAKEAGLDRATIYYYFPDKHAIFREAIQDGLRDLVSALEEITNSGNTPPVQLRDSMRAVMRTYEKHYPQLYLFFQDGNTSAIIDNDLNGEILESGKRYEHLVEEVVRDGIREGVFSTTLPPKVFAKVLQGMLNWTSRWFVPGAALSADDIADGMTDMVLGGIEVSNSRLKNGRKRG